MLKGKWRGFFKRIKLSERDTVQKYKSSAQPNQYRKEDTTVYTHFDKMAE